MIIKRSPASLIEQFTSNRTGMKTPYRTNRSYARGVTANQSVFQKNNSLFQRTMLYKRLWFHLNAIGLGWVGLGCHHEL